MEDYDKWEMRIEGHRVWIRRMEEMKEEGKGKEVRKLTYMDQGGCSLR